jgi:hypothetical protein
MGPPVGCALSRAGATATAAPASSISRRLMELAEFFMDCSCASMFH